MKLKKILIPAVVAGIVLSIIFAKKPSEKIAGSREFRFNYEVKIPEFPASSGEVDIFVPIPQSDEYQKISGLEISAGTNYELVNDPEYKNKILHISLNKNIPESLTVKLSFNVKRFLIDGGKYEKDTNMLTRFLMPDSLVPIEGIVKEEAEAVLGNKNLDPLSKAKLLYEHVVDTMKYDKKSNTGWGRGDVLYACDARTGNCTDFHSLFIGLNRAEKIPSRFVIGFPIPEHKKEGKISGYHCWAEFFTRDKGWIPVDASEAFKNPDRRKFYFGHLDPNRVSFTIGRDIPLRLSGGKIKKVNYLIYPYVFVNGKKFDYVQTGFSFKDLN